jgi:hypothetical protein
MLARFRERAGGRMLQLPHEYRLHAGERAEGRRISARWLVDPRQIVARGGDRAYVPTLEELIEACGENFAWLHQSVKSKKWAARDFIYDDGPPSGQGSTPTEAVARLWLALNKKKWP